MDGDNQSGPEIKRVLVTGADGFVGRRLTQKLMDRGNYIVFSGTRRIQSTTAPGPIELDMFDQASVRRAVEIAQPDIIYHLAAQSSSIGANASPVSAWQVNTLGTMFLATAVRDLKPDAAVIFSSSTEIYGLAFNGGVVDEETTPHPISVYGKSKYAAEMMLIDILPETTRLVIARPTNHSGAGQLDNFVLPSFARQVATGTNPIVTGNIDVRRDFLHVDDVVSAYIIISDSLNTMPVRSVFNIASGQPVSLEVILGKILRLAASTSSVVVDSTRIRNIDVPITAISSQSARDRLGWKPAISIDNLLQELISSYSAS